MSCSRLFEVEALRDGRLEGAERRDFERHLERCGACASEARALEQLGQRLRAEPASDELHVRREKTRLLAAFDRSLRAPRPSRRRAVGWLALAATVVALAWWLTRPRPQPMPPAAPSLASVVAQPGARWSRRTEAQRDLIFVDSGELHFQVPPSPTSVALLVVLPDGELEDIGTTFSVEVAAGATRRVVVKEGSVLLRLRGRSPIVIGAGSQWKAEEPPPPAPPPAHSAQAPPTPATSPSALPAPSANTHVAADEFRAAVSALHSGRSAAAAALFARFMAAHPSDARAQDAAYLRVVALQAAGDNAAMRAAAHDYLRAYPRGFRRSEVEALAR